MTTFDHRDAGTAEAAWAPALAGLPVLQAASRPLVVLAAHPDDETLGAGGLIAASARAGAPVTVVIATDGEGSHPASHTRTPAELAGIRRREVTAAVTRLAPSASLHFLGLPDGGLADRGAELDAALARFAPLGARLVAPYRHDAHPDHDACGQAAARAAQHTGVELWEYPIWLWHWADPTADDLPRLRALPLNTETLTAKRDALAEHASQHTALSAEPGDEAILPAGVLAHFERAVECFVTAAPAASPTYFDELYAAADDPWGLDDRFYERRKREVLLAALPRPRFGRAFEPGCATGALTAGLLARCDEIVAWDVAAAARAQARRRLGTAAAVTIGDGRIPADWPAGSFDLIVLSEVGYYCEDLPVLAGRVLDSLTGDGVLVACHWRQPADDHPHTAAEVHRALGRDLHGVVHHLEADFVLDVWARDGRSVAQQDGIR